MDRNICKINTGWSFFRGDESNAWQKGYDSSQCRQVTIPHDWSVEEPFSLENSSGTGYLPGGIGWYRKEFYLPEEMRGKKVFITFEGVYNNSQTWCNSYYIGKRPYGYSTFTYDITDFAAFGDIPNVVCVKVNHKDIADSRWFTGSGIYRDVYLTITNNIHIDKYGVFVTTQEASEREALVNVNVSLLNETDYGTEVIIKNSIFDSEDNLVATEQIVQQLLEASKLEALHNLKVPRPVLWSTENPYLYLLKTEVICSGTVVDFVKTPFGIRTFNFDSNKGFFLNGINMKIKGVCVHHDAGCLGAAVPEKVWKQRLEDLKDMGCNAIRMSHNPPAPNLLDLCDKMGFLVIDEAFDEWEGVKNKWATGHNVYPPKHFGYYEDFPQWGEADLKEMVLRDRNHPSIILWSIGNEVDYPNDPYCHPLFQSMTGNNDANKPEEERRYDPNKPNAERLAQIARKLVGYVKECDLSRPVTAALAFPELSNLTGYAEALDVVGYNYKEHLYSGDHANYPGRVLYGSENGDRLDAWLMVRDNEFMSAQFIWTGIDYLGEAKGWPLRASQAGFMDLAGFKKPKFFYRKSLWNESPFVYLAARRAENSENENNGLNKLEPHWNWKAGETIEVLCFTNCEEVHLTLNGVSLGNRKLSDAAEYYLSWEVEYTEGVIRAEGCSKEGNPPVDELKTVGKASQLMILTKDTQLMANGEDIGILEVQVLDDGNNLVYLAEDEISITVEGPGELIGIENGNPQDLEPYSSSKRKAYHGKMVVYIRTKAEPGEVCVSAYAYGLKKAEQQIKSIN